MVEIYRWAREGSIGRSLAVKFAGAIRLWRPPQADRWCENPFSHPPPRESLPVPLAGAIPTYVGILASTWTLDIPCWLLDIQL